MGRTVFINFTYTGCGEACAVQRQALVDLREALRADGRLGTEVIFLTVSFDPARDFFGPVDRSGIAIAGFRYTGVLASYRAADGQLVLGTNCDAGACWPVGGTESFGLLLTRAGSPRRGRIDVFLGKSWTGGGARRPSPRHPGSCRHARNGSRSEG